MITYRELSSLVEDLGFSSKALYSVSNHIHKHYKPVTLKKPNGESRQLYVPDDFLKAIQKSINNKLLSLEEISPYATAYVMGGSTKKNARAHVGKPVVLKLDIRHFFDHIIYPMVKRAFSEDRYSEQNRVLLAMLCTYKDALPQGAPTSPTISNIIMREFDNTVGSWCSERGVAYTRYCDDMTFSGDFDPKPVISMVKSELKKLGFFLNDKKTVVVRRGQRHCVTGIVVNEKLSVPISYKKQIRQEMYYCMKHGVAAHLERTGSAEDARNYAAKLLGRVNYVLSIEPQNAQMLRYRRWLSDQQQ